MRLRHLFLQRGALHGNLVGPHGCEITGIAYTPDLTTFFINIQPPTDKWPDPSKPARSSTLVVQHKEGKPVGAQAARKRRELVCFPIKSSKA